MILKTANVIPLFFSSLLSVVKTLSAAACHWVKTRGIWGMLFHNRDCMFSVWKSLERRVTSKGRSLLGKWVDLGVGGVSHYVEKTLLWKAHMIWSCCAIYWDMDPQVSGRLTPGGLSSPRVSALRAFSLLCQNCGFLLTWFILFLLIIFGL